MTMGTPEKVEQNSRFRSRWNDAVAINFKRQQDYHKAFSVRDDADARPKAATQAESFDFCRRRNDSMGAGS
jgi:hypothetical protein